MMRRCLLPAFRVRVTCVAATTSAVCAAPLLFDAIVGASVATRGCSPPRTGIAVSTSSRPAVLGLVKKRLSVELMLALEQAFEAESKRADETAAQARETLAEARETAAQARETAAQARETLTEVRESRDKLEMQLALTRGTLSKRWTLELALKQAHFAGKWSKAKFNATKTAAQLSELAAAADAPQEDNKAASDIVDCMKQYGMSNADVVTLYGKLSANIHDSGANTDSLAERGDLSEKEHNFIKCIAEKRFGI